MQLGRKHGKSFIADGISILIVMNYRPRKGGLTGAINELILNLKEEGCRINIVSTYGNLLQRLVGIYSCFRAVPESDLILGVGCSYLGFIPMAVASIVSFIFRKSIVYNFHSGEALTFLKRCNKLVMFFIGKRPIVTASKYVTNAFALYSFNAIRIPYHFNFHRSFSYRKEHFSWNNKVLYVRGFHKIYRPEMALSAAKKVLARNHNYEFHFFGGGQLKEQLEKKYKSENIIFRGFIERETLLREYERFSILINTSSYDNFPLSIIEAGYYQLLVLSTKVGGIATLFNDDELLYFYDSEDLKNLLLGITGNPEKFDSFRARLHEKVLSFDWESVRSDWREVFNNALKR